MTVFILRRLAFLGLVLFGVSILIFAILMTFSPERRAAAFVTTPQQAQALDRIIDAYGLDDPAPLQYGRWLARVLSGNLGWSLVASRPVAEAFWTYFPVTLELNLFAAPLIIFLGIRLGAAAAARHNQPADHLARAAAVVGWSLPTFLFALILLMVFYGYFRMFPPGVVSDAVRIAVLDPDGGFVRYTGLYTLDGLLNGRPAVTLDALRHLALPVATQVVVVTALLMRVMRASMIEELSREYVLAARARGADRRRAAGHARRNALIPVVTVAGQLVAFSMEGSVAVEVVFNRQGMGWWLAESATQLDIPVLMAACLFFGLVFVVVNLIIDILYAAIDPRIRLSA